MKKNACGSRADAMRKWFGAFYAPLDEGRILKELTGSKDELEK